LEPGWKPVAQLDAAPSRTVMRHRIAVRLARVLLPVILLIQLGAGAWLVWSSWQQMQSQHEAQLSAIARRQTEALALDVWSFNADSIATILAWDVADQAVARMRVLNLQGTGIELGAASPAYQRVIQTGPCLAPACRSHPIYLRLADQQEEIGTLQIETSTGYIQRDIQSQVVARVLELFTSTALLLFVLFGAIRQIVLLPLQRLGSALREVSTSRQPGEAGQSIVFAHPKDDEFRQVANGFNAVVRKVESDLVDLQQAERTAQTARQHAENALTELRTTQQALIDSERMASLGELVAGVAHEVNTPVGNILMAASTLNAEVQRFRQQVETGQIMRSELRQALDTFTTAAELLERNAERAATLVSNFKQIAVDQASEASRRFNLNEYLHSILSSLSPTLKHSLVKVEIDCPSTIEMTSYPGALAQCITNLVLNAVVHGFENGQTGQVTIATRQEASQVHLTVKDNGKGIPAALHSRVFEPFFTTRLGQGGSGLGLAIVRNIVVSQLGGQISLKSEAGQGTTFTLQLPLMAPSKPVQEEVGQEIRGPDDFSSSLFDAESVTPDEV